jgi:hypothetical protein
MDRAAKASRPHGRAIKKAGCLGLSGWFSAKISEIASSK